MDSVRQKQASAEGVACHLPTEGSRGKDKPKPNVAAETLPSAALPLQDVWVP